MAAAAPIYARFEKAQDVIAPLLVLAIVALLYGLYAPLIGYLNGRAGSAGRPRSTSTFATLRTLGLDRIRVRVRQARALGRARDDGRLGRGGGVHRSARRRVDRPREARARGARRRRDRPSGVPTSGAYLAMLLPIAGAQLCTNLLLQIDIGLLGRFLSESAAAGLGADAQRDAVKAWVAIYKECQTFAFLPYQLLFSVTLILFPMLARARAEGDEAAVRVYVARGARLSAIFAGLLVCVIVAMPESMLSFAYGAADARRGADVLRTMALAQGAFTMLGIATTVLTSLGRERSAALVTLGAVVAVAVACAALVPGAPFGQAQLVRSAQATGAALVVSLIVAGAIVRARAGAFVPLATAARVGLALAVCTAIGFAMPRFGRMVTPALALVIAAAYGVMLVVTGEVGPADLALLRAIRSKRS